MEDIAIDFNDDTENNEHVVDLTLDENNDDNLKITHDTLQARIEKQKSLARYHYGEYKKALNEQQRLEEQLEQEKFVAKKRETDKNWSGNFPWDSVVSTTAFDVFGIQEIRPIQREAINAVMSRVDVFTVMPTGSGKSLIFQLPHVVQKPGVTLVISPLIALMEDQVMNLRSIGVSAELLCSETAKEDSQRIHSDIVSKNIILYVTPERISKSKLLMNKLVKAHNEGQIKQFIIDEAHCCSTWGHDFRSDYMKLGILRAQFPDIPIVALTATASIGVVKDVENIFGMEGCAFFRASFNRKNLYYQVLEKDSIDPIETIANMALNVCPGETGVVYCFSRKEADTVAQELQDRGVSAASYHAMLPAPLRSSIYRKWSEGKTQVVVATIAFGLGIDKPNVRFVIHHTISKSIESYYQESGRAGRDGYPAYCLLFFKASDVTRLSTMVADSSNRDAHIKQLYQMVAFSLGKSSSSLSLGSSRELVCRRLILADAFQEEIKEESKCVPDIECCDICSSKQNERDHFKWIDATQQKQVLINIVLSEGKGDGRITFNQLVNKAYSACTKKRKKGHDHVDRTFIEEIGVHLLLDEYLEEYFYYTPYSIISYIKPGKIINQSNDFRGSLFLPKKIGSEKIHEIGALKNIETKVSSSSRIKLLKKIITNLAEQAGETIYPHHILKEAEINNLAMLEDSVLSLSSLESIIGKTRTKKYGKEILSRFNRK